MCTTPYGYETENFPYRYYDYDYDVLRHKRVRNRETSSITLPLGKFGRQGEKTEKKKRRKKKNLERNAGNITL